ncbi:carbamoyltransferase HypF [Heyndrickxia sp. MSNUG]|uniref:carbamoyltransferase HypF n=1 Tax=Heyndrickxia sp. MSNUG TaxID=3136677 RepID=UPI003C2CCB04
MLSALKAVVRGRVQGVGFRPFVSQLAKKHRIKGTVQNNMDGVKIHIEGEDSDILSFLSDMEFKSPRLSKIEKIIVEPATVAGYDEFFIIPSERSGSSLLVLPVDSAVCEECLEELDNPYDRRFHYPFINCTQCGPRYTIINELPYDRPYTSMKSFPMCPDCQREYEDPINRRHHAQPIACEKCGPSVTLLNSDGEMISADPLRKTAELLKQGAIIAIKGLGGYHLCCDAGNEEAVALLRKRKLRQARPLAVMARDLHAIKIIAMFSDEEKNILESPEAPIVVLRKRPCVYLAEGIAPGMSTVGVMLPYTPLHHLILKHSELDYLVITSANPSGQPILYHDHQAINYLNKIADYYLTHNREILHPVDDSVIQISGGQRDFLRRSRGYVPDPLSSNANVNGIVAFGGQQKSAFTIGRNDQIFVGPYIGNLENMETIDYYKSELDHLLSWIQIPFKTAAIDLHPGFNTRKLVKDYPFTEIIEVQHHHAHMVSCMADNQLDGDVLGIILDGTGYGSDGQIWGFEILYGNESEFERKAQLAYTPLPGGEKAIREPWRNAAAMLMSLLGSEGEEISGQLFPEKKNELNILKAMIKKEINSPLAGTCGRLFDAVSAICGVCTYSTYDGEAAIKFSELAKEDTGFDSVYPYEIKDINGLLRYDFSLMLKQISSDSLNGKEVGEICIRFHETIIQAISSGMEKLKLKQGSGTRKVVLSGGSFHNKYLLTRLKAELAGKGFEVYSHRNIPCNDGGLSLGQLIVAAAKRGK